MFAYMNSISGSLIGIESKLDGVHSQIQLALDTGIANIPSTLQANSDYESSTSLPYTYNSNYVPFSGDVLDTSMSSLGSDMITQTPVRPSKPLTSQSISPLLVGLPPSQAEKIQKAKKSSLKRETFVRDCMDVIYTGDEMASSNLEGKRNKRRLDAGKSTLVKRITFI